MTTRTVDASDPKSPVPERALATLADYARGKAPPPPRVRRSPNRHERRAILARGRDRATTEDERRRLGGKVRLRPVKPVWVYAALEVLPIEDARAVVETIEAARIPPVTTATLVREIETAQLPVAHLASAGEIDLAAIRGAR
jgi:hypothetical protein